MRTFFLFCIFALSPCLYAETPYAEGLSSSPCEIESGECAPVNTRLCEYSLPIADSQQTEEALDSSGALQEIAQEAQEAPVQEEDYFADQSGQREQTEARDETMKGQEAIAKFFHPVCYNHFKYYFFGPTLHHVNSQNSQFLESGSYVTLRNGSVWKMAEMDFWQISGWSTSDRLLLSRNPCHYSAYPYLLRNLENGGSIRVIVKVGPLYDSPLFCSCAEYNVFTGDVWCNDGNAWWVPFMDRAILGTWYPHDVMMIGINEDSKRMEYPYLLINLTNGSCCHASWVP